jgi:exosortase sorting signal-containing protein
MRITFNISLLFITLCMSIALFSHESNAQTYLPVGPQVDVPVATVTTGGWIECYRDTYDNELNAEGVLARCQGDLLMLSCRPTGSSTLALLAQGAREDVTFDTGNNLDVTHIANGVGWYFNISAPGETGPGENAWGFVRAGDSVSKNNCDVLESGANDERLCWHLLIGEGGYRCGATEDLNDSVGFERIVYTNAAASANIPTLTEWGLIAMAGILGLAGLLAARRRKAAA